MKSPMKFNFDLGRTGWMIVVAGICSAFAASAEEMQPSNSNIARDDAKQQNRDAISMIPHFQFFNLMQNASGTSCCHLQDGITDVRIAQNNDPARPLKVEITHTQYGLRLERPIWIEVPAYTILTADHAEKICEPIREKAEALGIENTCLAPSFSAVWINDDTLFVDGRHKINGRFVENDYIVPLSEYPEPENIRIYCLWEAPEF